jgi:hypothetical protein
MYEKIYIILIVLIIYRYIYKYYIYQQDTYFQPKIIWTHWDNMDTAPLLIKNILELRKSKLEGWKIHVLNDSNIDMYIDKNRYPKNYNMLMPSQKSDWIRLYLLKNHGGLWLDAGIVINNSIKFNELYTKSLMYKSELTGFYLNGSIINNDPTTFFESWFIMAPKNSRIINLWFQEFEHAINVGFLNYKKKIIKKGVELEKVYMFGENDTYLTIHATLQKLLQLKEISQPRILLYKAEDTMFKLHIDCDWDSDCIYNKITKEDVKHIPYIKLRGSDRRDGNYVLL